MRGRAPRCFAGTPDPGPDSAPPGPPPARNVARRAAATRHGHSFAELPIRQHDTTSCSTGRGRSSGSPPCAVPAQRHGARCSYHPKNLQGEDVISKRIRSSLAAAACLAAASWPAVDAQAAVTINFTESGSDVVASFSGSLNLSGLSPSSPSFGDFPYVAGGSAELAIGPLFVGDTQYFTGPIIGPASIGTINDSIPADAGSGTMLGFAGPFLFLSPGVNSGDMISGSSTWISSSLASLGLTPGSYVYSWSTDSVTLNIGSVTAVPEPSSFALAGLALGLVALRQASRRRKAC